MSLVAIVDDDDSIRSALSRLVRTIGYRSIAFDSAEALLQRLEEVRPSCVLTDVQMPGMSGLELTKVLREREPDLPVAVMTAYPVTASRERAMAAGATEYLTKPFDENDLERWLLRVIKPAE